MFVNNYLGFLKKMQKKSNQHVVQILILFSFFLMLPSLSSGKNLTTLQQDLVWSQSDGLRHEIFTSTYTGDEWASPVKVTDNNANNLHPVIAIGDNGSKWIFWSAVRPNGISIEYAVLNGDEWSEPTKLPLEQNSSITPSALADKQGGIWLVWAGNDGGNDDIYVGHYQKTEWSDPHVLHAPNDVPDITPEITYNKEDKIEVTWIGFRGKGYVRLASVYTEGKGWSAEQEKLVEQEVEEEKVNNEEEQEVELPKFLPSDSQFFLKIY